MSTESSSQPTRGVPALIGTIVGVAVMAWSFVTGIPAALDGGGSGATAYLVLFGAGAVLVLAGAVFAIVNLVRGRSRGIAVATLAVVLLVVVALIVLRVAAVG